MYLAKFAWIIFKIESLVQAHFGRLQNGDGTISNDSIWIREEITLELVIIPEEFILNHVVERLSCLKH